VYEVSLFKPALKEGKERGHSEFFLRTRECRVKQLRMSPFFLPRNRQCDRGHPTFGTWTKRCSPQWLYQRRGLTA